MSATSFPLDKIIRKIEPKDNLFPNEQLIIWDTNAGVTLGKEPLQIVKIFKKLMYFAFSDAEAECNKIVYRVLPGVSFDIKCKATCPRGNEGKVIAGLFNPEEKFEAELQRKIQGWLKEYFEKNKLADILNNTQKARVFLQQKIMDETGLSVIADVRLQNAEYLQPYTVNSKPFPVRVEDYANSLNLSFKTELVLLEGCESLAMQRYDSLAALPQQMQTIIERSIYKTIKLNVFFDELSKTVKPFLKKELNAYLQNEGRQILFLELNADPIIGDAEKRLDVECVREYKIADYSEQIKVKSTVVMKLVDLAVYKSAQSLHNITDLSGWFKDNVISVQVKDILFEKNYEDILVDMDDIKKVIEEKIKDQAASIGYTVMQHVFWPELKKLDIVRKGFEIVLQDNKYLSSDSRVSVSLSIKVYGNISNLKTLKERNQRMLLPNVPIEQEMQNEVVKVVEEVLHKIEPERFFMRFRGTLEEEAVDKTLVTNITGMLEKKFAVDGSSLRFIISPMENEVSQKVADLTKEIQHIEVAVNPTLDSPYTEKIEFTLLFRIMGVLPSGWHSFQMNLKKDALDEIHEIEKVLVMKIHESLVACRYQELMSQEQRYKKILKEEVLTGVFAAVSEKFGLFIDFIDYKRNVTITEIEASKSLENKVQKEEENARLLLEKQHASHSKIVDELSAERDALLKNGEFEEAEEVESQIMKVQEIYKKNLEKNGMDLRKLSGDKLADNNANMSLLESMNAARLIDNAGNN